jgi:hypothetical protein
MLTRRFALAAFLAAASGCIFVDGVGGGAGSYGPRPGPNTLIAPIAIGVGVPDLGRAGYIITANAGTYRITWAGFREFRGSVFVSDPAPQFFPGCMDGSCSLASGEDRVVLDRSEAGRIDFISFPGSGKRSGFDIAVPAGQPILLDILVEDARRPDRVTFVSAVTQALASAPSMPFGLSM